VAEASRLGHAPNGCRLASRGLSAVLEVAFKSQTRGRPKEGEQ